MGMDDVPRCQHVKVNGVQCGSPALRRRRRCYFHEGVRIERVKVKEDQFLQRGFDMPVLEDGNAVQIALMKVLQMLVRGTMDAKTAGLMLYGLQTASANLKNTDFEVEKVTDVVIDCTDVEQTCINGPQWFAHDFAEAVQEEEKDRVAAGQEKVAAACAEEAPALVGTKAEAAVEQEVRRGEDCGDKRGPENGRGDGRKRPEKAARFEEKPGSLAQILLERLGLPLTAPDPGEKERILGGRGGNPASLAGSQNPVNHVGG